LFLHSTTAQDSSDASLAEVRCHRLALGPARSKCLLPAATEHDASAAMTPGAKAAPNAAEQE